MAPFMRSQTAAKAAGAPSDSAAALRRSSSTHMEVEGLRRSSSARDVHSSTSTADATPEGAAASSLEGSVASTNMEGAVALTMASAPLPPSPPAEGGRGVHEAAGATGMEAAGHPNARLQGQSSLLQSGSVCSLPTADGICEGASAAAGASMDGSACASTDGSGDGAADGCSPPRLMTEHSKPTLAKQPPAKAPVTSTEDLPNMESAKRLTFRESLPPLSTGGGGRGRRSYSRSNAPLAVSPDAAGSLRDMLRRRQSMGVVAEPRLAVFGKALKEGKAVPRASTF